MYSQKRNHLLLQQSRLFSLTLFKMSESEEDSNIPDGAEAQRLVKEFESITNTDEIMGQMYLQVNVQRLQTPFEVTIPGQQVGPVKSLE